MGHAVLIAAHAAGGLAAFAAGSLALTRRSYLTVYLSSLVSLVVFLAAVVALDWAGLDTASRAYSRPSTFLGGYMIWRQSRRVSCSGQPTFNSAPATSTTSGSPSSPSSTASSSSPSTSAHRHG